MSIHSNQPNPGPNREVNLQWMANQFATGLQRHFDMLAFNLASRECVTEEAYVARVRKPGAMPAGQFHHNFEQMQAYARDLLVRQVINDSLNLASACLNNAHVFLAAIKAGGGRPDTSEEAQRASQQSQQEFVRAPLDQKFDRLERDYGIMSEGEDDIISLGFVLQALIQQNGVVRQPQVDSSNELKVELKVQRAGVAPCDVWRNPDDLDVVLKTFREGQHIEFSDAELQCCMITVAAFSIRLFRAVARYANEQRDGE